MEASSEAGREVELEHRVTALELFFDLVFVFAITQVTGYLAEHPTWEGFVEGLLILTALWWAWAAYAWLTNALDPEEGSVRLAFFASMAAMLVVALAVPNAFGSDGLIFALAYFVVRALHLVLFGIGARGDPELLGAVARLGPTAVIGPALLVAGAFLDGAAQIGVWVVALAVDYLGGLTGRARGWRVAPEHFVERHGLIIIIALGESIVAIGLGAAGLPLDAGLIAAALLGVIVACMVWWSYFDWVTYIAQARLAEASGAERAALARDLYSYLHLPMVTGIVLFALGLKTTIAHVDAPLEIIPAVGLCGGLALYLAAHVGFRLRIGGGLGRGRPVAALVLVALIPVAALPPALAALAMVSAVMVSLIAYEAIRHRQDRAWIRGHRGAFTMEEARRLAGRPEQDRG
jgi:low temperature requirement protein LtrA